MLSLVLLCPVLTLSGCQHLERFHAQEPQPVPFQQAHVSGHVRQPTTIIVDEGVTLSESLEMAGGAETTVPVPPARPNLDHIARELNLFLAVLEQLREHSAGYLKARDENQEAAEKLLLDLQEKFQDRRSELQVIVDELRVGSPVRVDLIRLLDEPYTNTLEAIDKLGDESLDEDVPAEVTQQIQTFIDAVRQHRDEISGST